jgi:transcriptional regulator with XRE-family HTH domain
MPARRPSARHRKKPDPLAAQIGARIKALRGEKKFTFDAFTEELGMGRGYLSELERGLVVPSVTALARVANALEVTMADLVLGASTREQLFQVTRDLPAKSVDELLSRARQLAAK